MYCQKCGAFLNENSRLCPQCGNPIPGEERNVTINSTYQGALGNPTPVLVWGIVGLAFSLSFYLSLLGVIFSIVGLNKSNTYNQFTSYTTSNKAKIGRRLSIAGIAVGSLFTILVVIVLCVILHEQSVNYA